MTLTALFWGAVVIAGIVIGILAAVGVLGIMVIINVLPERRRARPSGHDLPD